MKRSALFAAVALLVFAACASDKDDAGKGTTSSTRKASSSSTRPSTPPTTTKDAVKAFATTKRIGCVKATQSPTPRERVGLPTPIASVACIANGVRYRVEVYASAAERAKLLSAEATKLRCGLLKALGGTGPIYTVNGEDFSATASGAPGANEKQAKALAAKLGLSVTTTKCT
jgi:hypothetical protein